VSFPPPSAGRSATALGVRGHVTASPSIYSRLVASEPDRSQSVGHLGLIGVRQGSVADKRDLLLFDRVVVLDLEQQYPGLSDSARADVSYLIDSGRVEGVAPMHLDRNTADAMLLEFNSELLAEIERRGLDPRQPPAGPVSQEWATRDELRSMFKYSPPADQRSSVGELIDPYFRFLQVISHRPDQVEALVCSGLGVVMVANYLEAAGLRAVGLLDDLPSDQGLRWVTAELGGLASRFITVDRRPNLELAVRSLPVPADDVPLHEIIEFLSDDETRRHRDRLVRHLLLADFDGADPLHVALEIEESVEVYNDYMRVADIRQQSTAVTVILAVVGAIDDLLHLHLSAAATRLISIKQSRAERLLTQMNAPGRETAVIYEAHERFGARS
jgi:hypothetical protein